MDKQFWKTLMQNEYVIPDGHSLDELSAELLTYLGSTDPELRDDIAYAILVEWVERDFYTASELREQINQYLENLERGIGENNTDTVFLRAFSVLALALMIYQDNNKPYLEKSEVNEIFEKGLWYLAAEKDPRGYVQVKGWAHALAHTADLLLVLAENKHTDAAQHLRILSGITDKLMAASNWVYVHGEDDRLSAAVLAIFQRGALDLPAIKKWLEGLTNPIMGTWKGAWTQEESTHTFFNVRNFLRSLYLQVATEKELPDRDELEEMILEAVQGLRPY